MLKNQAEVNFSVSRYQTFLIRDHQTAFKLNYSFKNNAQASRGIEIYHKN